MAGMIICKETWQGAGGCNNIGTRTIWTLPCLGPQSPDCRRYKSYYHHHTLLQSQNQGSKNVGREL